MVWAVPGSQAPLRPQDSSLSWARDEESEGALKAGASQKGVPPEFQARGW